MRLLADACSPAASGAAAAALAVLDEGAARGNDFLRLFSSRARFPEARGGARGEGWGGGRDPGMRPDRPVPPRSSRAAGIASWSVAAKDTPLTPSPPPRPPLQVFERDQAVAAAEAHLQGLLPQLARAAGVAASKLRYVSIQNQVGEGSQGGGGRGEGSQGVTCRGVVRLA